MDDLEAAELQEMTPVVHHTSSRSPSPRRRRHYENDEPQSFFQKLKANKHEIALVLTTLFISVTAIVLADRANATISRMEGKLEVLEVLIGQYEQKITGLEEYDARLTSLLNTYKATCSGVTSTLDEIVRVNKSVSTVAQLTDVKYDEIKRDLSQVVSLTDSVTQLRQLWVNWNPSAVTMEREVVFDDVTNTLYCAIARPGGFLGFGASDVYIFNETGAFEKQWSPQRYGGGFGFNKCGQSGVGVFGNNIFMVENYYERVSPTSSKQAFRVNMFSSQGEFVRSFGNGYAEGTGDGEGPISSIVVTDIYLFTYDYTNHRIQAFRINDGTFSHKWGSVGTSDGQFANVNEIGMYTHNGYIVTHDQWSVSNTYYARLQWFTSGGRFSRKVQTQSVGSTYGGIFSPNVVFTANYFYAFVSDSSQYYVQGSNNIWVGKFDVNTGKLVEYIPIVTKLGGGQIVTVTESSVLIATGYRPYRYAFFNTTLPWHMKRTIFPRKW